MSVYRAINVWKFSNKLRALSRLLHILFSLPSNPRYNNRWRCALWQLSWISCANFPMKSFPSAKPNAPSTSNTRDTCASHLFKSIDWTSSHVIRRTLINLRNSVIQLEHMTWDMTYDWMESFGPYYVLLFVRKCVMHWPMHWLLFIYYSLSISNARWISVCHSEFHEKKCWTEHNQSLSTYLMRLTHMTWADCENSATISNISIHSVRAKL